MSHTLIYILCIVTGFMLGFLIHKELVFGTEKMYHDVHKMLLRDIRELLAKINH